MATGLLLLDLSIGDAEYPNLGCGDRFPTNPDQPRHVQTLH